MLNVFWLDDNGNKLTIVSQYFSPITNENKCVLYAILSNGEVLPMHELKKKYKQSNQNYIKG